MKEVQGWTYYHSATLNMKYAVKETPLGPEVMTEDKTRYTVGEIAVLNAAGVEVGKALHNVKRVFSGTVVDVRNPANP